METTSHGRPTRFQLGSEYRTVLPNGLPLLLSVDEVADLLRTSRKAVYSMVERGQLPGVTRIGRRVLIHSRELLDFLDHNRTPSQENQR